MTISGPDISGFQGGLRIQNGTAFVIAKATEGTYYRDAWYGNFHSQAISVGAVFSGYHFLKQEGSAAEQARYYHNFAGNTPCMLDVETEGSSMPRINPEVLSFINTLKALGGRCWGVYLPHWYWQNIGSPDLRPVNDAGAVIVSSAYDYVGGDGGVGWNAYGNASPVVWQFTDKLAYGGQHVDFNAYKGNQAQFAALVNGGGAVPTPAPVPAPTGVPVVSLARVLSSAHTDTQPSRPTGDTSNYANVIWVERALQSEGLLAAQFVDGSYGTTTVTAYRNWQLRLGYSGTDADGFPGMTSLSKLGGKHGFTVVA